MITNKQKIALADYIISSLKEEGIFKDGDGFIDQEQLEETCMAGDIICEALVVAGVIEKIEY